MGSDQFTRAEIETGRKLSPISREMMLNIKARTDMLRDGLNQVEQILRRQRGVKYNDPNNFSLSTADKIIEQFDGITAGVGLFAIAISAVGLLVGGIGVMNIMLVSVTERTREIGVRKAIGARKRDIVRQFPFEAMTLTSLGGVLGVILAVVVSYVIMFFLPQLPAPTITFPTPAPYIGLILPTSLCAGQIAQMAAQRLNQTDLPQALGLSRFDTVVHTEGCGFSRGSLSLYTQTLLGHLTHPLVKHALLLEHGPHPAEVVEVGADVVLLPGLGAEGLLFVVAGRFFHQSTSSSRRSNALKPSASS